MAVLQSSIILKFYCFQRTITRNFHHNSLQNNKGKNMSLVEKRSNKTNPSNHEKLSIGWNFQIASSQKSPSLPHVLLITFAVCQALEKRNKDYCLLNLCSFLFKISVTSILTVIQILHHAKLHCINKTSNCKCQFKVA